MQQLEEHRTALTGYCYRMLGSGFEAEDAVQETITRAWRRLDTYDEARGSLRSWLFQIATNICIDMLRSSQRRARAIDLGPASPAGAALGTPLAPSTWVHPMPDHLILDPAEVAVGRESVRLALVAALQHLPPRQRAVLILRDVLRWSAAEVAGLLEVSVAAVNSALQRARAAMPAAEPFEQKVDEDLLARYVDAFERYDVERLVSLLHEDATMSMPPFSWWLQGREEISKVLLGSDACEGARLVRTSANGAAAFGQYREGKPFALMVIETEAGVITAMTTFLDPALFPLFGLPDELPVPDA